MNKYLTYEPNFSLEYIPEPNYEMVIDVIKLDMVKKKERDKKKEIYLFEN